MIRLTMNLSIPTIIVLIKHHPELLREKTHLKPATIPRDLAFGKNIFLILTNTLPYKIEVFIVIAAN